MRIIVFVFLLFACSVAGQSKVGTTGANYLNIETSVTSIGMGQLNLIVPQDANFGTNPALLPFSHHSRFLLGGNPWTNECLAHFKFRTGYASLILPLAVKDSPDGPSDTSWRVAAAYRYAGCSLDPIFERTYGDADYDGTGSTFDPQLTVHQIVGGLAYSGFLDFGIGGSVKFGRESFSNYKINTTSFDLGVYGRVSIVGGRAWSDKSGGTRIRGMVGAAVTNFGPKINILDLQYDQPKLYRFSLGAEALVNQCRFLLGLQQDHVSLHTVDGTHLGGEFEWHRALSVRAGQSWFGSSSIDVTSIGGAVSLRGLVALASHGRTNLGFDLKVNYSHMLSTDNFIYDGLNAVSLQLDM